MPFLTRGFQQKIPKPWGEEILLTPPDLLRTAKILSVKKGSRLSFQYHDVKEETLCLTNGRALLWIENDRGEIEKNEFTPFLGYTIAPLQKHRIEALEDSVIFEVSSPESGTTVRIEDDYARTDETESIRAHERQSI